MPPVAVTTTTATTPARTANAHGTLYDAVVGGGMSAHWVAIVVGTGAEMTDLCGATTAYGAPLCPAPSPALTEVEREVNCHKQL